MTGASRGIGAAVATALADAGCDVAVTYRERADAAERVAAGVRARGRAAETYAVDMADRGAVRALPAAVERHLGRIDILINNAGIGARLEIDAITEDAWDRHFAVNVTAPFILCQAVIPEMRERRWGRIVNLTSIAAQTGGVAGPHYAATKGALAGLTHGYATRLVKDGITVNAVAPALIDTEILTGVEPSLIPLGRFGTPDETAHACMLLVRNAYMTGQTINVNGGAYYSS